MFVRRLRVPILTSPTRSSDSDITSVVCSISAGLLAVSCGNLITLGNVFWA